MVLRVLGLKVNERIGDAVYTLLQTAMWESPSALCAIEIMCDSGGHSGRARKKATVPEGAAEGRLGSTYQKCFQLTGMPTSVIGWRTRDSSKATTDGLSTHL